MDISLFRKRIISSIPIGTVINNPGGGTSTILAYTDKNISYRRGKSRISVSFENLFEAYSKFKGNRVSSTDLRNFAPTIFDSKKGGHSCYCTFLLSLLHSIGVTTGIKGKGKAHYPFYVDIVENNI